MKLQGEEKGWWKVEMKELRKEAAAKYGGREMKRRTGQGGKRRAEEGGGI